MKEYNLTTSNGDIINKTRADDIIAAKFYFRKIKNLKIEEFNKLFKVVEA